MLLGQIRRIEKRRVNVTKENKDMGNNNRRKKNTFEYKRKQEWRLNLLCFSVEYVWVQGRWKWKGKLTEENKIKTTKLLKGSMSKSV